MKKESRATERVAAVVHVQKSHLKSARYDDVHSFTHRQLEVALLVVRQQSAKEIGRRLNISPRTVEYHIERLKDKLACNNRGELIEQLLTVILTKLKSLSEG